MERSIQRNGLVNLLILLAVMAAGLIVARVANTLAGVVCMIFVGLGFLVAVTSWFQMRLEDRERLEKLEFEELAKSHTDTALFEAKDADVFLAQRSREQFEKYFVPIFTSLLAIGTGVAAWLIWRWLSLVTTGAETVRQPGLVLTLFGLFALILFLVGKYSATMARLQKHRLLRPGAGYLLLSAYLCAAVVVGVGAVEAGFPKADYYVAWILCAILAILTIETVANLVLEIYRPRVKGLVGRPLYESRLVGSLGQPEGIVASATQALDYQFGFKVSETWFYRLLMERALAILIPAQVALFLLSTCFVVINAGEQGLLERFGRTIPGRTILNPGLHVKWPWPVDRVYHYRTDQIQDFDVGTAHDESQEEEKIVLWTVAHKKEDNFLVANRVDAGSAGTNNSSGKRTPPISLITGTIPVQFQITNLLLWAYQNEDSHALLEDLATREIVRYLVGADMNEIMSSGRLAASVTMAQNIQAAADTRKLGARIVSVSLQDLHPPVKVAPEYEKVIGAIQIKEAKILTARAYDISTNALAEAQATNVINRAVGDRVSREIAAVAQAALFTNQVPAYLAAPGVYSQRAYLQTFVRSTANARKYLVLTTNTHDVLQFDLQDRIRADILSDLSVKPKN